MPEKIKTKWWPCETGVILIGKVEKKNLRETRKISIFPKPSHF